MGHSRDPRHVVGSGLDEDYHEFGDDVHMNDALFVKGFKDYYTIWKQAGALVTDQYDIRYSAGISNTGLIYYRDRTLPPTIPVKLSGRPWTYDDSAPTGYVELEYDFLFWAHETVEWSFANVMGQHKDVLIGQIARKDPSSPLCVGPVSRIHYRVAHQAAEGLEERLAQAMGLDVPDYVKACDALIKQAGSGALQLSPRDLDLYPYEDELDMKALNEIAGTGGPASYMIYDYGVPGGSDGRPFYF